MSKLGHKLPKFDFESQFSVSRKVQFNDFEFQLLYWESIFYIFVTFADNFYNRLFSKIGPLKMSTDAQVNLKLGHANLSVRSEGPRSVN